MARHSSSTGCTIDEECDDDWTPQSLQQCVADDGEAPHNNSLDASGGSVLRNMLGAAEGALIRAAASTQPLGDALLF